MQALAWTAAYKEELVAKGGNMKVRASILATALLVSGAAYADAVAPADVMFDEYGAIAESLTGVAGDPANGIKIMNKGKGNCIACHETPSLAEVYLFHGEVGPMLEFPGDTWSEAELRGIVTNAKNTFPDSMMPSFYKESGFTRPGDKYTGKAGTEPLPTLLTAQEIEDVVAYLMTLTE